MIHQYKLGGMNIVLDVCSGSVHVVDDVAYDVIGMAENMSRADIVKKLSEKYFSREDIGNADIEECIDDVEELKKEGLLFAPDTLTPTIKVRHGRVFSIFMIFWYPIRNAEFSALKSDLKMFRTVTLFSFMVTEDFIIPCLWFLTEINRRQKTR